MKFSQVIPTKKGMPDAYYCANMFPIDGGMVSGLKLKASDVKEAGTPLENLGTICSWAQGQDGIWGTDVNHVFFEAFHGLREVSSLGGRNIVLDIDHNVVLAGSRYIHKTVHSTLSSSISSSDTSMSLVDSSDFPSSGEVIITDGYPEVISYNGNSDNTLSNLVRGERNGKAVSHGKKSRVYWFDENWADTGIASTSCPMVQHENHVFVGNGHYIAGWDDGDQATFSTNKLDLPEGYEVKFLTSVVMGNQSVVLIGTTQKDQSSLFIWDGEDTTWLRKINIPGVITAMDENYIGVYGKIYVTDGYSLTLVTSLFNTGKVALTEASFPKYMLVTPNHLYCAVNSGVHGQRNLSGLWIWDFTTQEWISVLHSTSSSPDESLGAFVVRGRRIDMAEFQQVSRIEATEAANGIYWFRYAPETGQRLQLNNLRLNIETYCSSSTKLGKPNFDIIVRLGTNLAGINYRTYTVSDEGTFSTTKFTLGNWDEVVSVGDRVMFLAGAAAREIRNVVAKGTETDPIVTVDEAFLGTPGNSEELLVSSLKKITKISVTDEIDLKDLYVPVPSQPIFQTLIGEIEFRCSSETSASPKLNAIELSGTIL